MIDHWTTSRDHQEADGLAKKIVQTVKRSLHKYGLQKGHLGDWDIKFLWLAMGYRFSKQTSLLLSHHTFYFFGREPELSMFIRRDVVIVINNLDTPDMWVQACEQLAILFKRVTPMALENLTISQHQDTLRYATIRGGGYCPRVRCYESGDYVYLQQTTPMTLDVIASRIILRVQAILQSRMLLLEGRDGQVWKDHVHNCAPCHLPHIDRSNPGDSTYKVEMHVMWTCNRSCHYVGVRQMLQEGGIWDV